MQLHEVLTWLMGAGAGVVAFFIIDRVELSSAAWLASIKGWLLAMESSNKRWFAYILAGVIAVAAYLVSVVLQADASPGGIREWIKVILEVAIVAIVASQIAHGGIALRRDSN